MSREVHNYIHIPKTGGTALKYVVNPHNNDNTKTNPKINLPMHGHNQNLKNMDNACFIIRHPWERFCSGFWERVTMPQRRALSKTEQYKDVASFGYRDYDGKEKEILGECKTPDEYVTYLREKDVKPGATPGLFELTASMTHWLGNIDSFKSNEHRIKMVFHINNMDRVMKDVYNLELPKDPFRKRSRALFDNHQPYGISPVNRNWFENQFRLQDYDLIRYIKTRPFYYE